MTQITVTIDSVFKGNANGADYVVDLAKCPEDKVAAMLFGTVDQGIRIIMQRAEAEKGKGNPKIKQAKMKEIAKEMESGEYSFGGGGSRGPQLSVTDQAWKGFLKVKANKDLEGAKSSYVMAQLVNAGKAKATDPALSDLTLKYRDVVLANVEKKDPTFAGFLKAAQLKAGAVELPTFNPLEGID